MTTTAWIVWASAVTVVVLAYIVLSIVDRITGFSTRPTSPAPNAEHDWTTCYCQHCDHDRDLWYEEGNGPLPAPRDYTRYVCDECGEWTHRHAFVPASACHYGGVIDELRNIIPGRAA